jgi:hypothetical protein
MWVEELDEKNFPSGMPRAYIVPYSPQLARQVDGALADIQQGEDIAGSAAQENENAAGDTAERLAEEAKQLELGNGGDAGTVGDKVLRMDFSGLEFAPLPAPITPPKPL